VLDNLRWEVACSWTLALREAPHVNLIASLFTRPTAHGGSRAEGSFLFFFVFDVVIFFCNLHARLLLHLRCQCENSFSLFHREWPGCGTRPCLSLRHQQLFLPSALRLRRARRREICSSSLQKFTHTATWVSMWVKKKPPLSTSTTHPTSRLVRDQIVFGTFAKASLADPALRADCRRP
jgi:hypothetical protein